MYGLESGDSVVLSRPINAKVISMRNPKLQYFFSYIITNDALTLVSRGCGTVEAHSPMTLPEIKTYIRTERSDLDKLIDWNSYQVQLIAFNTIPNY